MANEERTLTFSAEALIELTYLLERYAVLVTPRIAPP